MRSACYQLLISASLGFTLTAGAGSITVLATQASIHRSGEPIPVARVVESLDRSPRQLDTAYIDVFQLHMVPPSV
jgi:aryl-alcohol dehydrogenase-like predicted oxidoreductase